MLVVIDTNVIFQGLDSAKGASFYILRLLEANKINIALSYPVIHEYEEILKRNDNRERLQLTIKDIDDFLAYTASIAVPFDPAFLLRPNLRDEKDNIFSELAFVSNADFLITSNIRDFTYQTELKLDNFTVITPKDFVKYWRETHEK
jgi:putative PIN family toxin of toxin-antitoxin system